MNSSSHNVFSILIYSEKFCVGREGGNYRNPWNCHNYFTCVGEHAYDRPCSTKTVLNYSPKYDICEYPSLKKCVNIGKLLYS